MDIERFVRLVSDPRRTKTELNQMRENAIQRGESEFARIVHDELNRRFPGWDEVHSKRVGATPTRVAFRGVERRFETAKGAYLWLIERFIEAHPGPFLEVSWETVFVAKGTCRLYFARNLKRMFFRTPRLASDANNYVKLTNGWYANLNLSNEQKFSILCKFAAVGKFKYEEWAWEIEGQPSIPLFSS